MDIDNASISTTGTAGTLGTIVQDGDNLIESLGTADLKKTGDGGDSDCEHEDGQLFISERDEDNIFEPAEKIIEDDDVDNDELPPMLIGVPDGWEKPGPPPDWTPPLPKVGTDCPDWDDVDNPGDWDPYSYQARYSSKTGKYKGHRTPTGATVVPEVDGARTVNGWSVTYDGSWTSSANTPHRHGASEGNILPDERDGQLDGEYYKKMGLTKERMQDDYLFFHQLMFPICDPAKSGIDNDPRKSFYHACAQYTNMYALQNDHGGDYGHEYRLVTAAELVRFDGMLLRHGVLGGGHIHHRFISTDPSYDSIIAGAMTFSRFIQIKAVLKLNDNRSDFANRDSHSFDPANKYDLVYEVLVHNMNAAILRCSLDICIDETTWAHMGFGGCVLYRVKGKPGVTKGGQVVMAYWGKYPLAYVHRHSLQPRPPGFSAQGPSEMFHLFNILNPLVVGNEKDAKDRRRQIFPECPHAVVDNHFPEENVFSKYGGAGWGVTGTTRRDRLIKGIDKQYFHHEKKPADRRSKAARWCNPIVFSRTVEANAATGAKAYEETHTSFQSTGSTRQIIATNRAGHQRRLPTSAP